MSHAECRQLAMPQLFGYNLAGRLCALFKHSTLPDVPVITLFKNVDKIVYFMPSDSASGSAVSVFKISGFTMH
jgi:hypothetical protein